MDERRTRSLQFSYSCEECEEKHEGCHDICEIFIEEKEIFRQKMNDIYGYKRHPYSPYAEHRIGAKYK